MNSLRPDLASCIGRTPLIRLREASRLTGCEILGKAEFLNPGGSIKDRTALGLVLDAQRRGLLGMDTAIVEGTAGNTGIGLTLVGNSLGRRSIIYMPATQSASKIDALRQAGAEVVLVPAAPYSDPGHYAHAARARSEAMNAARPGSAWFADQFDNLANSLWHEETTGPELWADTHGQIDGFVCAAGTGGTLAGVGRALKARRPQIMIGLADPAGSALAAWVNEGALRAEGDSISEGIGSSRITANFARAPIDQAWTIPDSESIPWIHRLLHEEGYGVGGSSGVNIAAAARMARQLGPGHTIVTMLADPASRYPAKLFNPAFLAARNLPVPAWLESSGH